MPTVSKRRLSKRRTLSKNKKRSPSKIKRSPSKIKRSPSKIKRMSKKRMSKRRTLSKKRISHSPRRIVLRGRSTRRRRSTRRVKPLTVLKIQETIAEDPFQNVLPPGTNIQTPYIGDHVNMSNKDLRALVIFGAVFKNKQFNNTHLEGTKFIECSFVNTDFDGAHMDNKTEFIKCVFRDGIENEKQNFERQQIMMMGGEDACDEFRVEDTPDLLLNCLIKKKVNYHGMCDDFKDDIYKNNCLEYQDNLLDEIGPEQLLKHQERERAEEKKIKSAIDEENEMNLELERLKNLNIAKKRRTSAILPEYAELINPTHSTLPL